MSNLEPQSTTLSRRSFLRGQLPGSQARRQGRWQKYQDYYGRPGEVFWCAWADEHGTIIAGDDGLVIEYNGKQWQRHPIPVPIPIHAMWGLSRQSLWAVGWMGLILKYDGEQWQHIRGAVQDEAGKYAAHADNAPLFALSGRNDGQAWAVGDYGSILHFDGQHWQQEQSNTRTHLRAVCCLDDGRVLAAGGDGQILLRDESQNWQLLEHPYRTNFTTAIALDGGQILLAGGRYFVDENGFRGELYQLNLADNTCAIPTNTQQGKPDQAANNAASNAASNAVNSAANTATNNAANNAVANDGHSATDAHSTTDTHSTTDGAISIQPLFSDTAFSRFRGLLKNQDYVLAVGDQGHLYRIKDHQIEQLDSETRHDLLAITELANEMGVLAVGDFGTVLGCRDPRHSDTLGQRRQTPSPSIWQPMSSPTTEQLWGLWTHPQTQHIYACGEAGTVLYYDGQHWSALPQVADQGIHALCAAPNGGLLAAGQFGQIFHYDGHRWQMVNDIYLDITLLSLWADNQGTVIAVGDEGYILHHNPETGRWRRMPSGTQSALYNVWGLDAQHALAVGDFGLVLRWNGTRWDEFNVGTEQFLFDVWGRALDDLYVVGLSGTIGHFDGQRWSLSPVRSRADLLAIAGSKHHIAAVGAAGAAFIHDGHQWVQEITPTQKGLRAVTCTQEGRYVAVGDEGIILQRHPHVD